MLRSQQILKATVWDATAMIPASMPAGGQTAHTKGNTAKFAAGKKTVSK
jgi:hypothetical protein